MTQIKSLTPKDAYKAIAANPATFLLDVRDRTEFAFVGHPVGAVNIPWKEAPSWVANPGFVDEVRQRVPQRDAPILVLCRSGQRSLEACKALAEAGYADVTNIEEGFEGPIDGNKHRGALGGWRFHGLAWEQS